MATTSYDVGRFTVEAEALVITATATSITLDFSHAQSGDTLLAIISKDDDVATTPPSGWTSVHGFESNNAMYFEIWKREATGTETTYSWTGDSEIYVGSAIAIRGADYTTINVGNTNTGASTSPQSPAVTTSNAEALVLTAVGWDRDRTLTPGGGGYTNIANGSEQSAGGAGLYVGAQEKATAGTLSAVTHTLDVSDEWATATIYIDNDGSQKLTAGLLTNTSTFPSPTVTPGPVTAVVPLYTNTSTLYTATSLATYDVTAAYITNTSVVYSASVTTSNDVTAPLIASSNQLFTPTVMPDQFVRPDGVFVNNNTFFQATSLATYDVTAPLINNSSVVHGAIVTTSYDATAPLIGSVNNVFAASSVSNQETTRVIIIT